MLTFLHRLFDRAPHDNLLFISALPWANIGFHCLDPADEQPVCTALELNLGGSGPCLAGTIDEIVADHY